MCKRNRKSVLATQYKTIIGGIEKCSSRLFIYSSSSHFELNLIKICSIVVFAWKTGGVKRHKSIQFLHRQWKLFRADVFFSHSCQDINKTSSKKMLLIIFFIRSKMNFHFRIFSRKSKKHSGQCVAINIQ